MTWIPPELLSCVIDAGPLLTMLTLEYVRTYVSDPSKKNKLLEKADGLLAVSSNREKYRAMFGQIRRLHTTSHIIGELSGLAHSCLGLKGVDKTKFLRLAAQTFCTRPVHEELISLEEISKKFKPDDDIWKLGMVDTGILMLAQKLEYPILTVDKTLAQIAGERSIKTIVMKDILWQY